MTEAIYTEVAAKQDKLSGMLKYLGVSILGYNARRKRLPSDRATRKERCDICLHINMKKNIQK